MSRIIYCFFVNSPARAPANTFISVIRVIAQRLLDFVLAAFVTYSHISYNNSILILKETSMAKAEANKGLMKPVQPDDALAAIVGASPCLEPRSSKSSGVHQKARPAGPKNKRNINADDKLKPIFGGKAQVSMFEMNKLLSAHLK